MERALKENEVETLRARFANAEVAICADYRGLKVSEITKLRRELRSKGAWGRVVKNSLAKISVERSLGESEDSKDEMQRFLEILAGPSFVIFSEQDPVTPAKVLADFMKEHQAITVKGAWLDGAFVDVSGVESLSKLPGREELLAKLLSLMVAPATQLVRTIQAPGAQMVRLLEAQRVKISG
jgi:large subunit ribosomal protein L10